MGNLGSILTIIGISGIIMTSCTGSPGKHYPRYSTFPNEKPLSAQVITLDTALLRSPFRVAVRDSIAIILDLHNADYFFHAFTYPKWNHIVSFGKRGETPDDMLSAETFKFQSLDSIWALDANRMQITRWSVSSITQSAKRVEQINLDRKLIRSLDLNPMDSCFLIPDYSGEHRIHKVSKQGKMIGSEGTIPSELANEETSHPALAQAWRSFIDYNPDNGILAMATQLGETIEIYNLKENTHIVLYGPNGEPKFKTGSGDVGFPTGIMGFNDIKVTDQYIYAVFEGRRFKDIMTALQHGEKVEKGGRSIYVFDLKGNPVCKYTLDHAIQGINVNEETNTIVATNTNNDDPILVFKI